MRSRRAPPVQPREVHQRLPEGDVEQRESAFEQRGEAPLDREHGGKPGAGGRRSTGR